MNEQLASLVEKSKFEQLPEDVEAGIGAATLCAETLKLLLHVVRQKKNLKIFEFGSGISTRLFDHEARKNNSIKVVSLESSEGFYYQSQKILGSDSKVNLKRAAMKPYTFRGKKMWAYDNDLVQSLAREHGPFDLVSIDGPKAWLFGRTATMIQIAPHLAEDALVFLDDATREYERKSIQVWQRLWGDAFAYELNPELKNGLALMTLKSPQIKKVFPFGLKEIRESRKAYAETLSTEWKQKFIGDNL